jgi:Ca2+-binding EF-hand superfamily protein
MKKLIAALAITAFTASASYAQVSFETVDADGNGGVTMEEASAAGLPWTEDQFKAADTNQDGALDAAEFAAATAG